MYIPIGPSKKQLYKIIIALLLLFYLIFLGMYKPKAESIESSIYYTNGTTYQMSMGNGTYAGISIKYIIGGVVNPEKFSFYINTGTNTNYKYMSGWIRYKLATQDIKGKPVIIFGGNDCIVNDSLSNDVNYVAFTCPNLSGKNWLDIMFQTATINEFYISRNIGYSDIQDNNQSTLNNISTSSQDTANNTYYIKEGINDVNNTLNDSSIDNSSANNLTNNSAFQDANGLDNIIKAPLNFIQSLTSTSCSPINLTIPFMNADVSLPCMSSVYTKALGTQLVNTISLVINGIVLYRFCLVILHIVHNAKNPNKDELEVLDL